MMISIVRKLRSCLALGLLVVVTNAVTTDKALAQARVPDTKIDTVVFWGLDFSRNDSRNHDIGLGAGFVTSLSNDMSVSGWALSAYLNYADSKTSASTTEDLSGWSSLGYIWQFPGSYLTLGVGFAAEADEDLGGFAQYGFETTSANSFYVQSYGSISGIDNAVYALGRVGYLGSQNRYGLEVAYLDDDSSSETWRYGLFVGGIEISPDVTMIASLGYQEETHTGIDDGIYAAIGFSIPLSLR